MAEWNSTTTASTFDAKAEVTKVIDARTQTRSAGLQDVNRSGSWNCVGISADKIPDVRKSIETAVSTIQGNLREINENAATDNAFKSEEITIAVKKYIEAVENYSVALVSTLNFASSGVDASVGALNDNATVYQTSN